MNQNHARSAAVGGGVGMHRVRKRAAAATTAEDASTSTTKRKATTATAKSTASSALLASQVDNAVVASSSSSFKPGAAASGTATKAVGNTPPATTKSLSTVDATYYSSFSFATKSSISYDSNSLTSSSASSSASASAAAAAASTGGIELSQTAIYGIIAGGAAAGVILLAIIGCCCWKKRKAKKADEAWLGGGKGAEGKGIPVGGIRPFDKAAGSAWESTDSLAPNAGYAGGGGKGWGGADSSISLATLAKSDPPQQRYASPPPFAVNNLDAARAELFSSPSSRSLTPSNLGPAEPSNRQRTHTDGHSVNDVISFSGAPKATSQYPPTSGPPQSIVNMPPSPSQHALAHSAPPSSRPFHLPQSAQHPPSPQQHTTRHPSSPSQQFQPRALLLPLGDIAPRRPSRPSEVPSEASSAPFSHNAAHDSALHDHRLEDRFMAVMGGAGNEREEQQTRDRQSRFVEPTAEQEAMRRKKDTILGFADAYAGGGEDDWGETTIDASFPQVASRQDLPKRTTSRRAAPPALNLAPPVPPLSPTANSFPMPPSSPAVRSPTSPAGGNHYSSRIDSQPMRELENYLAAMPTPPGARLPRTSEGSDLSSAFSASRRSRVMSAESTASGGVAPLSFPPRRLGPAVPPSGSKDSLSPFTAASGAHQTPYGDMQDAPSIRSFAASINGSASSSPSKFRPGMAGGMSPSNSAGSPMGSPLIERPPPLAPSTSSLAISATGDFFAEAPQRPTPIATLSHSSNRTAPPAPLRLARNASLANRAPPPQEQPPQTPSHAAFSSPSSSPTSTRKPLTMSAAERDVLNQLGLPSPSLLSSSTATYESGERTPELFYSTSSHSHNGQYDYSPLGSPDSSNLDTPRTPQFPSSPGGDQGFFRPQGSYLDVSPSPSPSPSPTPSGMKHLLLPTMAGKHQLQQKPQQQYLDPLQAGGFESLAAMAAQKLDPSYRSATMSIYGMYD